MKADLVPPTMANIPRKNHILSNILIGIINSVILLEQAENNIALVATNTLDKSLALAKAEAYRKVVTMLQEQLVSNFNE